MIQNRKWQDQILDAARKDSRRRRRELVIIVFTAFFIVGLLYLAFEFSGAARKSALTQPFAAYLFTFAVWALILILILTLLFLTVRNVVKFLFERRRGVLGARIRMRMIMAFLILSLGPSAALFLLSTFIISTSIEQLYNPQVMNLIDTSKRAIEEAATLRDLSRRLIEEKEESDYKDVSHYAQSVSRSIFERGWAEALVKTKEPPPEPLPEPAPEEAEGEWEPSLDSVIAGDSIAAGPVDAVRPPAPLEQLQSFIELKRREFNLELIAVFNSEAEQVALAAAGDSGTLPTLTREDFDRALENIRDSKLPEYRRGLSEGDLTGLIYVFYPVPRRVEAEPLEIAGMVAAGKRISWMPAKWRKLEMVEKARGLVEDYETMKRLEQPIKYSYFILLSVVTLTVIFLAVWFGFYMAKGITEPLQILAEGTDNVASGNLDYRIDLETLGEDEMSRLLVRFNQMIDDIQKNRAELDLASRSLRESNAELEQKRRYMETVLGNITAGVLSIDSENRLSAINPAARRMLELDEKLDPVGLPLDKALKTRDLEIVNSLLAELDRDQGEVVQRQLTIGRERRSAVILVTVSRLRDDRGRNLGAVAVIDDITEMIRAHRAMAWREVARRIAHEIKNPLTPIKLSAQRLERRLKDRLEGDEAKIFTDSIKNIIVQVEQLKHLVNEFSLFARLPSTRPAPEELHDLLAEVVPLYREAHPQIRFRLSEDPELPILELDHEQMKRVFVNLLDNAVAGIGKQPGEIVIETAYDDQLRMVRIEIRDNGHGIPPPVKDRLFEPYFSTKPGGSGLGLTIVQRIISDHYGYLRVLDNEPRGTRVIIELPVILAGRDPDLAKETQNKRSEP